MTSCCSGEFSIAAEMFMEIAGYDRRNSAVGHGNGYAPPFACRGLT
jgi:hypothetical protein